MAANSPAFGSTRYHPLAMPVPVRWIPLDELASTLGIYEVVLVEHLRVRGIQPHKHRGTLCVDAGRVAELDQAELAELRRTQREARLKIRTSQRWVAGYDELVAQWHRTKNGDLFPDQVTFGSHRRIWWKCPEGPDHEWIATPNKRSAGSGCPFCAGLRVSVTNAISTVRPELAAEWHPTKNGRLGPGDVTAGSQRQVWWRCARDPKHVFECAPADRAGCPFCTGKQVDRKRSLAALYPALARQWHPTKNELRPREVLPGSHETVWWRCSKGHEWEASPKSRALQGKGCPFCAHRRIAQADSLAGLHPELLPQFARKENGDLDPNTLGAHSPRRVWWRCSAGPDHVWQTSIANRTMNGTGCPFCAGQRVSVTNALATVEPRLAREWDAERNGELTPKQVTSGSAKRVWWVCREGHHWEAIIANRARAGTGCPECARALKPSRAGRAGRG